MSSLVDRLIKKTKNPYVVSLAEDFPPREYIDTGNIIFNCLVSANPFGGIPTNKIMQLAGPESTGKTYLIIEILKQAQKQGYTIIYYDTEAANDVESFISRGIERDKFIWSLIGNVKDLQSDILNMVEEITKNDKVMIIIDSLGMLMTDKEFGDAVDGKKVRDMTRAQELRSLFRTITLPTGVKNIPVLVANHVYDVIGSMYPTKELSGGGGSKFASSLVIELSKAQEKLSNGTLIGALISCTSKKNRLAKEKLKVKFVINYTKGLNRYSGLFNFALEFGHIKVAKVGWYTAEGYDKQLRKADIEKDSVLWDKLLQGKFKDDLIEYFSYHSHAEMDGDNYIEFEEEEGE